MGKAECLCFPFWIVVKFRESCSQGLLSPQVTEQIYEIFKLNILCIDLVPPLHEYHFSIILNPNYSVPS